MFLYFIGHINEPVQLSRKAGTDLYMPPEQVTFYFVILFKLFYCKYKKNKTVHFQTNMNLNLNVREQLIVLQIKT